MSLRCLIVVVALSALVLGVPSAGARPGSGARAGAIVPPPAGKGTRLDERCQMKVAHTYALRNGSRVLAKARWLVGNRRFKLAAYIFGLDAPRQAAIQWGYYDVHGKPHVVKTFNRIVPHQTRCVHWTIPKRLRHQRTKFVQMSVAKNNGGFAKKLVQFVL